MKIFISYRRDDTAGYAGRLFDHLSSHFGKTNVFMDIDTIEPGDDFRNVVKNAVGTCDVVLVMIGKQWLSITNSRGQRRLDDPRDWVRVEIASALANPQVRVIPVLVRDADVPNPDELPDNLKDLSWRNAIELSDQRFQYDANKLISVIEKSGKQSIKTPLIEIQKIDISKVGRIFLALAGLGILFWLINAGMIPIGRRQSPTATKMPASTLAVTSIPFTSIPTMEIATASATAKAISPAVLVVDQYYKYINNAGIDQDLRQAWDLMTNKLQCNPNDNCNFDTYRSWWWQEQVQYKLYDCGSNSVVAELIYYSRNTAPNLSRTSVYVSYELIDENGQLKLNSARTVPGISAYCELATLAP